MTSASASTAISVSPSSTAITSASESASKSESVSATTSVLVATSVTASESVSSGSVSASKLVSVLASELTSVSESALESESASKSVLESALATVLESTSKLVSGSASATVSMSSSVSLESASNQIPVIGGVIGVVLIIIIIVIITLLIVTVIIQRKKRYSKSDKQPLELPLTAQTNNIIKEDNKYADSFLMNDNSITDKDTSVRVEPEYAVVNKKEKYKKEKETEEVPIQQQQLPLYEPTYTDIEALKLSPHHIYNEPSFDPLIPATLPVSMEELGNHVATCHSNGFEEQYKSLYTGEDKSCSIGYSEDNKAFNRFKNITVYDDNRITLITNPNLDMCQREYINANYVHVSIS
ncbi:PREDICTED: receptor-type tyrosine-protein phosphatase kappa-like [Amphimedon queenslandica]|uniref:Tyrosine-protein phosphatase domain-containing protein n=1 Tax=Amphimedon queenslandica TaxID=400682 RepID=A0AAN0J2S8_AMPQE|nr:PREDICTED: receptor-type tyrosine-protein phosphatase kappa-like [Amphimedon queenslandica]|eukprot:XP_019851300.1 PREDICTED: receptor-type tyrosine-protein phosphatase kappa-like [Amphimedon queenslandica]